MWAVPSDSESESSADEPPESSPPPRPGEAPQEPSRSGLSQIDLWSPWRVRVGDDSDSSSSSEVLALLPSSPSEILPAPGLADLEATPAPNGPKRRRFDCVRNFSIGRPVTPPQPMFLRGTEWWASPLFIGISDTVARMPQQPTRPMSIESFCGGTCGEAFGAKANHTMFVVCLLIAP